MGLFLIDLALLSSTITPAAKPLGISETIASITGIHLLVDLAGIAFAGGLYIVPAFAAVQAWSPVERRSRVIAGCNVLSAAFMTVAGLGIAGLQYAKIPVSIFYAGLGFANIVVVALVLRAWGAEGVKDVGVSPVPDVLQSRSEGTREPAEARRERHHRAEPRQFGSTPD